MHQVNSEMLRESLEKIVGEDDSTFSGFDLATLIRNKYGRSYDVQLIKKLVLLFILPLKKMWFYRNIFNNRLPWSIQPKY